MLVYVNIWYGRASLFLFCNDKFLNYKNNEENKGYFMCLPVGFVDDIQHEDHYHLCDW